MKRLVMTLLASAAIVGAEATPAAAQGLPKNPKRACATLAQVDPEAYSFLVAMQVELGLLTPAQGAQALAIYEDLAPQLQADNRAECVSVLRSIHGGLIAPLLPFFPPQG